MSKKAMLDVLTRIETDIKKSSNAYRTLVSNYEIHDITINAQDIIKQVEAEMLAREGRELTEATKRLITSEVKKMCNTLYNTFNPENYNANKQKWTISSEFKGTAENFTFVLASKPGKSSNVFNTFKKAKQIAQRPLIKALNKKIKELNKGSKNQRDLISSKKGFLDIGHDERSSVSLQRAAKVQEMLWSLDSSKNLSPLARKVISELSSNVRWELSRSKSGPPRDTIGVSLESKALNRASVSKGEVSDLNAALKSVSEKIGKDWAYLEGSDSPVEVRKKTVADSFIKPLKGKKGVKVSGSSTKIKKSKVKNVSKKVRAGKATTKKYKDTVKGATITRERKGIASSPLALIVTLNKQLPDTIRKNMQSPALVNRTGRFADSVRVTDIVQTQKGYPSIGFTYQKSPYQTFEPGYAQGSPERDPRHLIDRSIREIAAQFAIGRFYTRRV